MGRSPLTISTWRGSSWLGGAGTENWIFLRSLGSMAGGARAVGSRAAIPAPLPRAASAPRWQRAECGREALEGCSRTDKNTAPARGGRAGVGGGRRLAALGPLGASVPWRPHLGLAGLDSVPPSLALSVSLQPSSISLARSPRVALCLCFAPSLRVSPSGPSLGVPSPSPRPGTGARALGGRARETAANGRRGASPPGREEGGSAGRDRERPGAPCRLPGT